MSNKELVQRFHDEVLNERKYDNTVEFVSPQFIFYSNNSPASEGMESFRNYMSVFQDGFPDLTFETLHLAEEEDVVYLYWKGRGNNTASLMGLPPTNKHVEIQGISLFELDQGRIKMNRVVFNILDLFQQLGVNPSLINQQ
ncbi:ester cyclase [Bacillus sp. FJAT-27445]|uniref:ester cyclase n=1 Tax=Bacillus sp. FJAT-27445 TaxID=1679166 RepID=UPI0007438ED1|nr:ester cyclase [Bacillus sp. FJAT-27445]